MKKLNLKIPSLIAAVFMVLNFLSWIIPAAQAQEAQAIQEHALKPLYAPGELIIKLKPGRTLEELRELNSKYQVISPEKIFKETIDPKEALKGLKEKLAGLGSEHQTWYWQLDKDSDEYKNYLAGIEKEREELQKQIPAQEAFIEKLAQRQNRAPKETIPPDLENIYLLRTNTQADIPSVVSDYQANTNIEYAEPNYLARTASIPNDPLYSSGGQWAHKVTQTEKAWDREQGSSDVIIGIVDTGVDYSHEDLAANIWQNAQGESGKNLVNIKTDSYIKFGYKLVAGEHYTYDTQAETDPMDYNGHGTHSAGITAAKGNNGIGISGVCQNCKIMPVRAGFTMVGLDGVETGLLPTNYVVAAIQYAASNGADIINLSFTSAGSLTLKRAIDDAYSKGVFLVAAAGNDYTNAKAYPAAYENVIAVSATGEDDTRAYYSNYGSWVDLAGPGGIYAKDAMMLSTVPPQGTLASSSVYLAQPYPAGYKAVQGTSAACAYVSGVAGLILSKNPSYTKEELSARLLLSADDLGKPGIDDYYGNGRVNGYKALSSTPLLQLKEVRIKEGALGTDRDGILESNENVELSVTLQNMWPEAASSVTATLTTDSPYIISLINHSVYNFGSIGQNQTRNNSLNPFTFNIGHIDYDTPAEFMLTINVDGIMQTFRINVELGIRKITTETDKLPLSLNEPAIIDISGNKIVWQDYRNGNYDIYLFDLSNNLEKRITTDTHNQYNPAISGNKIVWQDDRNGNLDIYLFDLSANQERRITADANNQYNPDISGNKIVWDDGSDIYLFDLSANRETRITNDANIQNHPAIWENKIVWQDDRNANWDIYLFDLESGEEREITTNLGGQYNPDIWGNKIVWWGEQWSDVNNRCNIRLFDLEADQEMIINPGFKTMSISERKVTSQSYPAIWENKIVWQDYRNANTDNPFNTDIYLYELDTQKESRITADSEAQITPVISGNKIAWWDGRKDRNIYSAEIKDTTPPVLTITTPSSNADLPHTGFDFIGRAEDESGIASILITVINEKLNKSTVIDKRASYYSGNGQWGYKIQPQYISAGGKAMLIVDAKDKAGNISSQSVSVNVFDATPPEKPVVKDEGDYTLSTTTLSASFSSSDPQSGIAGYEYMITRDSTIVAADKSNLIRDWTPTGTSTKVTATGLNLTYGKTYYFSVKAKNGAGSWSDIGSNGITVKAVILAPSNLRAELRGKLRLSKRILLRWEDNSNNEDGFIIEHSESFDGPFDQVQVSTARKNTKFLSITIPIGSKYYYRIYAYNQGGNSEYSNVAASP